MPKASWDEAILRILFRSLYLLAFLLAASNSFIQPAGAPNRSDP